MTESKKLAVIYTDGGCKETVGGYAFHGYEYTEDTPKQGSGLPNAYPSDRGYFVKSAKANGPKEVTIVEYFDHMGNVLQDSTNNECELLAFLKALEFVIASKFTHVQFLLDSEYTLGGAQSWLANWKRNGWVNSTGNKVANMGLWMQIDKLLLELSALSVSYDLVWVKGHSGEPGNDQADMLASKAIILGRKHIPWDQLTRSPAKGYWSASIEYNRMLSQSRLYINTNYPEGTIPQPYTTRYYFADIDNKDDDFLGKPSSNTSMSVVYLRTPDPVLTRIRDHQTVANSQIRPKSPVIISPLTLCRMDRILNPHFYTEVLRDGCIYLQTLSERSDMFDYAKNNITREISPVGRAFHAQDTFLALENILHVYVSGEAEVYGLVTTDITSHWYERIDSKKKLVIKLKESIDPSIGSIVVPVDYSLEAGTLTTDLRLVIGLDTPTRNTLNALAKSDPSVLVLTWRESPIAFRYAIIVKNEDGIGIWSAVYANIKTVP